MTYAVLYQTGSGESVGYSGRNVQPLGILPSRLAENSARSKASTSLYKSYLKSRSRRMAMKCLKCANDTLPAKALCAECLDVHNARMANANRAADAFSAKRRDESYLRAGNTAGFWLRFLCYSVDMTVIGLLAVLFANSFQWVILPLVQHLPQVKNTAPGGAGPVGWAVVFGLVGYVITVMGILLLYYPLFDASRMQGTPGKWIFRIKVVDSCGDRLSKARAFYRGAARYAPYFLGLCALLAQSIKPVAMFLLLSGTVLMMVQYPMAAFTEHRQTLHDRIAHVFVVHSENPLSDSQFFVRLLGALLFIIVPMVFVFD